MADEVSVKARSQSPNPAVKLMKPPSYVTGATFWQQFKAIMVKNWILKKRKLLSTLIIEILLPVAILAILALLRNEIDDTTDAEKLLPGGILPFIRPSFGPPPTPPPVAQNTSQGGPGSGRDEFVPPSESKLVEKLTEQDFFVTVIPSGSQIANDYIAYLSTIGSGLAPLIKQQFTSEAELETYTRAAMYGLEGNQPVGAAIIFDEIGVNNQW
eukprot:247530_1